MACDGADVEATNESTAPMTTADVADATQETVPAGVLPDWTIGNIPEPPVLSWRNLSSLIGPGILLAGASIASGEWLAGPGLTAQFGGTLLWIATLSIVAQVFANIEFMRYTVYCGEPLLVGAFRIWPGPIMWAFVYAWLEIAQIWPYNVANAAVPLASAALGRLPGPSDAAMIKALGVVLFLLAFVPLMFGGTVYKTLERIMSAKMLFVLGFLGFVSCFLVSRTTALEVFRGFVSFGQIPIRADSVIDGRHFMVTRCVESQCFSARGTVEPSGAVVTEWKVNGESLAFNDPLVQAHRATFDELLKRAEQTVVSGQYHVADVGPQNSVSATGAIRADGSWGPPRITVDADGATRTYDELEDVSDVAVRERIGKLIDGRGLERVSIWKYLKEHGRLPELDWALIAAFASIAGAGGLTNVLFSNYARDKGYGMGAQVGAIPSAIGGTTIKLSHVGKVFRLTPENKQRWNGWMKHVVREQAGLWMACCFIGMALPCMMSVEFIRNAPVSGVRVAAMMADGIDHRHPGWGLWPLTLFVAFLVLYPGQILSGDTIPRRWCDIIWVASPWARRLGEKSVKYVYYSLMFAMGVFGLAALLCVEPLSLLKISGVIGNVALAVSAGHALYVNCTLLPVALRPSWFMRAGVILCSVYFFGISAIAVATTLW